MVEGCKTMEPEIIVINKSEEAKNTEKLYLGDSYQWDEIVSSVKNAAEKNNWKALEPQEVVRNSKNLKTGEIKKEYDHSKLELWGKYKLIKKMDVYFTDMYDTDHIILKKNISVPYYKLLKFYANVRKDLREDYL